MSKTQEHAKNIPEAEERRRTFVFDTVQNPGNNLLLVTDNAVQVH